MVAPVSRLSPADRAAIERFTAGLPDAGLAFASADGTDVALFRHRGRELALSWQDGAALVHCIEGKARAKAASVTAALAKLARR